MNQLGTDRHTELRREIAMTLLDDGHRFFVFLLERRFEQFLELVRDTGYSGMHDEDGSARGAAFLHDARNVFPVGERGNARAAELEDDPRRMSARHR